MRFLLRLIAALLAAFQTWNGRFYMDPDGTAYADVARAWLRGDWSLALNGYWSPLYSWLLALIYGVFKPGPAGQILATHLIHFGGFLLLLVAWEWLLAEWEAAVGPPTHPHLVMAASYCGLIWVGLRLNDMIFTSADILVTAITLACCAFLLRMRRMPLPYWAFAAFGLLFVLGYFAKTAFLVMAPVFLIGALLAGYRRGALVAMVTAVTLASPYVIAISLAHNRFTVGDSGGLNYAWNVAQVRMEGYKDGPPGELPDGSGPFPRLFEDPPVLLYTAHPTGTFPPHADPVWWSRGIRSDFTAGRQFMVLGNSLAFVVMLFATCPVLWLALVAVPFIRPGSLRSVRLVWFVAAGLSCLSYALVAVLPRYLAAPFAVFALLLLTLLWQASLPRAIQVLGGIVLAGCTLAAAPTILLRPTGESTVTAATRLRELGMHPGDGVGFIGNGLVSPWLGLNEARILAMVPARIYANDRKVGRPTHISLENPDRFWQLPAAERERIIMAFRDVGARWAFADHVPATADVTGWRELVPAPLMRRGELPFIYYRRLD